MNKALTIATLTMAMTMTTVPLTAHAETVDEANQATQTAYQAYQQAEAEKTQAWNDSHGDIYSDAWQTADTKSKALYNAYLDARQHAGLVSAEAKRNSSSQEQEPVSSSNSSASETQDLTGDSASKASNDSNTKSDMPTTDPTKATQTADSDTKSATPTKAIQTAESNPQIQTVASNHQNEAVQPSVSSQSVQPKRDSQSMQTSAESPTTETTMKQLPQTGSDIKNKTMLTLIGSGVMGIATAAMIILIRERHHD